MFQRKLGPALSSLGHCGRYDGNHDRFTRRCIRFFGDASRRDERVSFREIRHHTTGRKRLLHDDKAIHTAVFIVKMTDKIDALSFDKCPSLNIFRTHHHDATLAIDSSVSIVVSINGRVVLVMAPNGSHEVLTGFERDLGNGMNRKLGSSGLRVPNAGSNPIR